MPIPPIASTQRLDALFPPVTPDPAPQTFELGLVLGGTVSVGAFTAGALDFLIQALEAWEPSAAGLHRVVIKTAAGSSGGAVCTSVLGLLSGRPVPHITGSYQELTASTANTGNPLWELWVNQLQIMPMFSTTDLERNTDLDGTASIHGARVQHAASLLNADVITQAAASVADFGTRTPAVPLPYFAHPFRIAVTVANMRGVPYQVAGVPAIGGFEGAAYVQHDDFAWFALPNGTDPKAALPAGKREDEFWVGPGDLSEGFVGTDTLGHFAAASGAMPLVLASRALSRPAEHYNYRPNVRTVTDQPGGYRVDWPVPDWTCLTDTASGTYGFTAVDGGTMNNDPVSLVHRALCGLVGQNPRGKSDASRAILMIDPLADAPQPISQIGLSIVASIGGLVPLLVGGARYLTSDMALFASDDVFSRFQLVPYRPAAAGQPQVGEKALAGDSLFAAGGWCAREYRVHDFMLGRQNMQHYMRTQMLLAGDNPLFKTWSSGKRMDYACDASGNRLAIAAAAAEASYYLPILPDDTGEGLLEVPPWPAGVFNAEQIKSPLQSRLDAVVKKIVDDNTDGGLLPWLAGLLIIPGVTEFLATTLVDNFKTELKTAGLQG